MQLKKKINEIYRGKILTIQKPSLGRVQSFLGYKQTEKPVEFINKYILTNFLILPHLPLKLIQLSSPEVLKYLKILIKD